MLRKLCFTFFAYFLTVTLLLSNPREGMWIPVLLDQLSKIEEMQAMGLRLTSEDIYSINNSSIKDAIVRFGGGCSSSFISEEGLLLTNHHCGYSQIQSHSTLENDLLTNGYWAMDRSQELPNPGLTATLIVRIEDVTEQVLALVDDKMSESRRSELIREAIRGIVEDVENGTHHEAAVHSFFYGNEFFLFVTETFHDVRLVGAPPQSIGKFGGDLDNWMWPRHTGDFALFRVYAAPDGSPAEYSVENTPYRPRHVLPVSITGIQEKDFTFVFGFPGRTEQYLPSYAVDYLKNQSYPARIRLRDMRLTIMDEDMRRNDKVRIQYAAKQSRVSNAWKKWQGEIRGLNRMDAIGQKQQQEMTFRQWASSPENQKYRGVLDQYQQLYGNFIPYATSRDYVNEAAFAIELVAFSWAFNPLARMMTMEDTLDTDALDIELERLENVASRFFRDYNQPTDQRIFPLVMQAYYDDITPDHHPDIFKVVDDQFNGDFNAFADFVYSNSFLVDEEQVTAFLENFHVEGIEKLEDDIAFQLTRSITNNYFANILPVHNTLNAQLESLNRLYIEGLRKMEPDEEFYPDANSTLRISYGKIESYEPRDGVIYEYQTHLDGIMEKFRTGHEDYKIPLRLLELYESMDFGRYSVNGKLPVNFIASNHTTGGNSGSPVMNGRGEFIGVNFDRNWEGTMSDLMYDPDRVRNISVDARYILFIIDKFAGAGYLIDEMIVVE